MIRKHYTKSILKLTAALLVFLATSCRKDEAHLLNACFNVAPKYPLMFDPLQEYTGYVDSVYVFKVCSLSTQLNYRWDFGDGTNSAEESPTHSYHHSGGYEVTLSVYRGNQFLSSAKRSFNAIVGQKAFKVDDVTIGIAVGPSIESGFFLLGASGESGSIVGDWFLAKFDSELLLEWKKPLWPANGMTTAANGDIIVTGKANELGSFSVTRLSPTGEIIWDQEFAEASNAWNVYTTELNDGNYVTIGHEITPNTHNSLLGLNSSGGFLWKKDFLPEGYRGAIKVVAFQDGCLIATSSDYKLVLIKLDANGNVAWERHHDIQISSESTILDVENEIIYVSSLRWNKIHRFDPEGTFIQTFDLEGDVLQDFLVIDDDLFYVADYSWDVINYGKIDLTSETRWSRSLYHFWNEVNQSSTWEGHGKSIIRLPGSEVLIMGNRRDKNDYNFTSVFLVKIDREGNIK